MRNRLFATAAPIALVCLMTAFSVKPGLAADAQNYTGKYSLQERKNGVVSSDPAIVVVQTENSPGSHDDLWKSRRSIVGNE